MHSTAGPKTAFSDTASSDGRMDAFLLRDAKVLEPVQLAIPRPGAGQVLIRVHRAGICGSDVHYFTHGKIGRFVPNRPLVLGHEFAGEVIELGKGVSKQLTGQRVAVDPSIPCETCDFCKSGRYNLCRKMRFFGSASCDPHLDGAFSQYVVVPSANCHVLDDCLSWGEAALTEPLSVVLHASNRSGGVAGKSVLVTGGGAIGQLQAIVARTFGAAVVVLSDPVPYARAQALMLGADHALDPNASNFEESAMELSSGGFDLMFEASGATLALTRGLGLLRRGATLVQVGTLPAQVTLPFNDIMAQELTVVGSFRFANVFGIALRLMSSGRIGAGDAISAVYPLSEMPLAINRAMAKTDVIKVQVEP
jgi:L-idonate 5-dehydrogenase